MLVSVAMHWTLHTVYSRRSTGFHLSTCKCKKWSDLGHALLACGKKDLLCHAFSRHFFNQSGVNNKKKRDFLTGDFQHFPSGFDWFGDFPSQSSYLRPGLLVSRHSSANLSTDQKIGDRSFRILAIKLLRLLTQQTNFSRLIRSKNQYKIRLMCFLS